MLDDKTVQKIDELANYIDEYYYEDYDKDDLENGLLHGVMEGLNDPYSVYYTADEYKELQISTTGTYYGIGAALKQDPNTKQVTVSKVYSGTPSEEAGLKKDDEIVSVDGVEATSEDLTKLVAKIRGEEGTKVTLEIRRGEEADPFTVEVERKMLSCHQWTASCLTMEWDISRSVSFRQTRQVSLRMHLTDLQIRV